MKKVVFGLLVAALAAVGVMGGVVLAQSADAGAGKSFAERVAEILGLDSATVEDAMTQAKSDMADERVQTVLDKMVTAGKVTQAQADAYLTWHRARPEGAGDGFFFDFNPTARADLEAKLAEAVTAGEITQAKADAYLARYQSALDTAETRFQTRIDKMVAADKITQAQADAYMAWYQTRPAGVGTGWGHGWFGPKKGRGSDHGWHGSKSRWGHDWGRKDS